MDENENAVDVDYFPTCVIIIPVEELFEDGPLQYHSCGDLVAAVTSQL